ncbi:MAG: L,D-transpeptidase [Solirubrobacteraceae bacterium]|nr:L,D-transpeptidase [Solirubrobacteraceae bacterium]
MSPASRSRASAARWVAAVAAVAALSLGAAGAARGQDAGQTASAGPTTPAEQATPAGPTASTAWVARIVLPVTAWAAPRMSSTNLGVVEPLSPWGGTNRLLVLDRREVGEQDWLLVRLPGRPNARQGWVQADAVDAFPNRWRIEVSRAARTLTVWHAGAVVRRVRVVVGKAKTPTPGGTFAIADLLRQPDSSGFAGSWVLPLTAHSNVLEHFDGGDGQVALHGRGGASLKDPLGSARSHGCIRLANADIAWIAERMGAGTMVRVR